MNHAGAAGAARGVPADGHASIVVEGRRLDLEYRFVGAEAATPLVVFLHEGLGSLARWKDYPESLCAAAGVRGLVFSRPGYGRSTPRPGGERWAVDYMHRQAESVLPALFATLGIESRVMLFGHSDGASIALLYASAHPERVAGVIAVAPHVMVEDLSIASIQAAREAYDATDLRERLGRYHDDPDSAFRGWNDVWLDPDFRAWSIEDRLPQLRCPVLAVQGEDDEYGTMAQIESIARLAPSVRLVKIAACRHSPQRDQPAVLTAAAAEFIDDIREREAGVPLCEIADAP